MRWTFWVCWRQCCNNCYLDTVISKTGKLPLPLKLAQMRERAERERAERERAEGFSQPVCCRFGTPICGIESNYLVILTLRLFAVCRKTLCALRLVTIQVGLQVPPTLFPLSACPALSWLPCALASWLGNTWLALHRLAVRAAPLTLVSQCQGEGDKGSEWGR